MNKSFSVAMGLNEQGRANYDRIFGKKRKVSGNSAKPTAGMKARSRQADAVDKRRALEAESSSRTDAIMHDYALGRGRCG